MRNMYMENEALNHIMVQNTKLYRKISNVCSNIGSRREWESRRRELSHIKKRKNSNNYEEFLKFDEEFYNTYKKLKDSKDEPALIKIESNLRRDSYLPKKKTQSEN
jgi:hypothetical protein